MRLMVNENLAGTVIRELRQRGHDVLSVKESMRSEVNDAILARTQWEERIVVTHDKDFGELAFRYRLPASCGVSLLRLSGSEAGVDNRRILEALESRSDWEGHFSVITDDRIRLRPLPGIPILAGGDMNGVLVQEGFPPIRGNRRPGDRPPDPRPPREGHDRPTPPPSP
jgi:predicted nuclease of predicted toxin-antitoxin system